MRIGRKGTGSPGYVWLPYIVSTVAQPVVSSFSPKMTLKSRYSAATVGGFTMDVWMKNSRRKISAEKIYGIEKPAD